MSPWPNNDVHLRYGTALCVFTTPEVHLEINKRYDILDLDVVALGPGVAEFDYYVKDERGLFTWASSKCFSQFEPRSSTR